MSSNNADSIQDSLSDKLLFDLPSDPFEQLDIARRITDNAWKSRVASLEKEVGELKVGSDPGVLKLQRRVADLEKELGESKKKLSRSLEEQAKLDEERNSLVNTVKKLNREIVKLEAFKRTLMQQLEDDPEEEAQSNGDVEDSSSNVFHSGATLGSRVFGDRNEANYADPNHGRMRDPYREASSRQPPASSRGTRTKQMSSDNMDVGLEGRLAGARILRTRTGTRSTALPTPSLSPFFHSSQAVTPRNSSPKRQSGDLDSSQAYGKDFFIEARRRLSFEEFKAFLENIKDLSAKRKSRKEALQSAAMLLANEPELYKELEAVIQSQKVS